MRFSCFYFSLYSRERNSFPSTTDTVVGLTHFDWNPRVQLWCRALSDLSLLQEAWNKGKWACIGLSLVYILRREEIHLRTSAWVRGNAEEGRRRRMPRSSSTRVHAWTLLLGRIWACKCMAQEHFHSQAMTWYVTTTSQLGCCWKETLAFVVITLY